MIYLEWMLAHPWASLLIYLGVTAWLGMALSIAGTVMEIVIKRKGRSP